VAFVIGPLTNNLVFLSKSSGDLVEGEVMLLEHLPEPPRQCRGSDNGRVRDDRNPVFLRLRAE